MERIRFCKKFTNIFPCLVKDTLSFFGGFDCLTLNDAQYE